MKLLGLIGLLLLATLLPSEQQSRRASQPPRPRLAPIQIIRSPWAAQAPKTVRRVPAKG